MTYQRWFLGLTAATFVMMASAWGQMSVKVAPAAPVMKPTTTSTAPATTAATTQPALFKVDLIAPQTLPALGAIQGLEMRDGFIYVYGDADTGVIRQFTLEKGEKPKLKYTGVELKLTRNGEDLLPHPTGMTFHPEFGTFIGSTVKGKGTIAHIDFKKLLKDRNLDNAVLNVIEDDAAVNGTRPEFVRKGKTWYIATSDYGNVGNELRLYDPKRLAIAKKTSEKGVVVERRRCGPWVQNLHWIDEKDMLVFIQNRKEGLLWRLTPTLPFTSDKDLRAYAPFDGFAPTDELEGFHMVGGDLSVSVTAYRQNNSWVGKVTFMSKEKE